MDNKKFCEKFLPIPYEVEAGKVYRWCACGKSKTQPLCDRADCNMGVDYYAYVTETILFCGCKQTQEPPLCDGSHAKFLIKNIKS